MALARTEEQRERLGGPLMASSLGHALLLGVMAVAGYLHLQREQLGDPNPGGQGAVTVSVVDTIPLPRREGPQNPVATDTESVVPETRVPEPKVEREDPDAIALDPVKPVKPPREERTAPRTEPTNVPPRPVESVPNPYGQQANNPMYGRPGSGGVGVNENSVFGTRFGAYAEQIRRLTAQQWNRAGLSRAVPRATLEFQLHQDGSVSAVRVIKSSGNYQMDQSIQRAVLTAKYPRLPVELRQDQVRVEFIFEVTQ